MRTREKTWLSFGLMFVAFSGEPVFGTQGSPQAAQILENTSVPVRFEENVGQTDGQVRFISRGPGYVVFLTSDEAVFKLSGQAPTAPKLGNKFSGIRTRRANSPLNHAIKSSVLRMRVEGAKATPTVSGVDKLPGVSNYFIGNDSTKWRVDVPSYGKVQYSEIYSGVDLAYYGNGGQIEYDFTVKSGADPAQISLAFDGAQKMSMDSASGDISIETAGCKMTLHKPAIYQMEGGKRKPVEGNYELHANGRVAFDVKNYNRTSPLVIDPVLAYSTYIGGSFWDEAVGIAVDADGNAYVTGDASSLDFPVVGTSISPAPPLGGITGVVSKINSSGTALVYSTFLGGTSGMDIGWAIAVDANGYVYVGGDTGSNDFPVTTSNAYQTTFGNGAVQNVFVAKLSADGQSLLYSTYLGGNVEEDIGGIAVDTGETAYLTGVTASLNFPTTSTAIQNVLKSSNGNGFVTRIDTTQKGTSSLVYSTFLGGASTQHFCEGGSAIAIDSQGFIYVSGVACSSDFPLTSSAYKSDGPSPGSYSAFVSKIDTNQSGSDGLKYSTYFGGTDSGGSFDAAEGLALDTHQNVYLSGFSSASDFPTTTGARNGGAGKAFVAKFDTTKAHRGSLIYSTLFGSTSTSSDSGEQDDATSVMVDAHGNAYLTGFTYGIDFPTTAGAIQSILGDGPTSSFLTVVNKDASKLLYSTYWGGTNSQSWSYFLTLDTNGDIYLAGLTQSSNFETTTGSYLTSIVGTGNAFVTKFMALSIPDICSLSRRSGPRRAQIAIKGSNFGSSQGSSTVTFGEDTAPILSWQDKTIDAQVPAFAPIGLVQLKVNSSLESSDSEPFEVTEGVSHKDHRDRDYEHNDHRDRDNEHNCRTDRRWSDTGDRK